MQRLSGTDANEQIIIDAMILYRRARSKLGLSIVNGVPDDNEPD